MYVCVDGLNSFKCATSYIPSIIMRYHFGIPGYVVWFLHIVIGCVLLYVGYQTTFQRKLNSTIGLLILVMGALAVLYLIHIWITHLGDESKKKTQEDI